MSCECVVGAASQKKEPIPFDIKQFRADVGVICHHGGWVSMNIASINIASMDIDFHEINANEYNIYWHFFAYIY